MGSRIYANLPKEFVEKIRDDPNNKGYQPEIDAIEELEYRATHENMQKIQSDIQKLTIPHWTRNWTFYLVVVAFIISLAALALQWRADIRDSKSSPVTVPSTTTKPSSPPISTQKKSISQHKHVPMKT